MPEPDLNKLMTFYTSSALREWLESHHLVEKELWIKVFKKESKVPSVTWDDLVIEALCFGWIDGIKKSLDDTAYIQRITPRKTKSSWSKRNRDHVERLIKEGRMTEAGMVQVRAAQEDGRWENAYAVREMTVPDDFIEALSHEPSAKHFFEGLTKSSRYVIAHGLLSAKKPETRQKRFDKYRDMMIKGEKPN